MCLAREIPANRPCTIIAGNDHVKLSSAQITSIEEDSISYKSNWVNVEFGCDAIVDGKPLVVAVSERLLPR